MHSPLANGKGTGYKGAMPIEKVPSCDVCGRTVDDHEGFLSLATEDNVYGKGLFMALCGSIQYWRSSQTA